MWKVANTGVSKKGRSGHPKQMSSITRLPVNTFNHQGLLQSLMLIPRTDQLTTEMFNFIIIYFELWVNETCGLWNNSLSYTLIHYYQVEQCKCRKCILFIIIYINICASVSIVFLFVLFCIYKCFYFYFIWLYFFFPVLILSCIFQTINRTVYKPYYSIFCYFIKQTCVLTTLCINFTPFIHYTGISE